MYESEFTKFMRQWMDKHPEQVEEQRKGRKLWWDKPQDLATRRAYQAITVAQKAYPYLPD